ncbi:MAG: TetR/AcrR family transcriptional regulator [Breznakibacter sp.]
MQIQKEEIRQLIIEKAREEFETKGFKDASMRTIAQNAGVGLSNIYNYFRNKDELFREVLTPVLKAIDSAMEEHNDLDDLTIDYTSETFQYKNLNLFVGLVEKNRVGLKLLLFQAAGSSFENFRDHFTDRYTQVGMQYLKVLKERYPQVNTDISEFFMHTASSWWLAILGEIVTHDLNHDQITRFISEYIEFGVAGWKRLMRL